MGKYLDLTGKNFERLTCIKPVGRDHRGQVLWSCLCNCGNEKTVLSHSLVSGNTKSCGCIKKELLTKRNTVHALSKGSDGKKTRLYNIWVRMKQRCSDENSSDYDRYGGRGIKVCEEWLEYKPFHDWSIVNGYANDLSIERMDNNGNYEPVNCKWVTDKKQARNKRNNHFISHNGMNKTLAEWSELTGIDSSTLRQRLNLGWSVEKTLNTLVGGKR